MGGDDVAGGDDRGVGGRGIVGEGSGGRGSGGWCRALMRWLERAGRRAVELLMGLCDGSVVSLPLCTCELRNGVSELDYLCFFAHVG